MLFSGNLSNDIFGGVISNFIYCLCDDSLFVYQKILCVYVLEKVKTILHFFLVIHQQSLMKTFFVENGCILGKSTKGA